MPKVPLTMDGVIVSIFILRTDIFYTNCQNRIVTPSWSVFGGLHIWCPFQAPLAVDQGGDDVVAMVALAHGLGKVQDANDLLL